jgi:hypothetical protein
MNLLFIFTAFQMQNPCQGPRSAKSAPNSAKTATPAIKSKKNVAFFSIIFSK